MSDFGVVVVIEDDLDMRNLLKGVLLQSGFEVHTASGGREGVDVVVDIGPDVVTVDVGLPDIDGFEVLLRIREFSNAYVVMLTGREDENDVLTALQGRARPSMSATSSGVLLRRVVPRSPVASPAIPSRLWAACQRCSVRSPMPSCSARVVSGTPSSICRRRICQRTNAVWSGTEAASPVRVLLPPAVTGLSSVLS